MKKIYLTCALLLSYAAMHAVNVTFRVDMTGQTVHPAGVHIAGSFNPGYSVEQHMGVQISERKLLGIR